MYPSVLTEQLEQGVNDFLRATFVSSTPAFHGMLEQMLGKGRERLFKGPYLSIQLPFQPGQGSQDYFPQIPMRFRPYLHQEQAFARLRSDSRQSTLIATGTGSGKSECFLFPILDHCLRHKDSSGIKAILIYPMNALANDQSKRIAKLIFNNQSLQQAGVTAGLYIGEQEKKQARLLMSQDMVITDHAVMQRQPPDILVTNYKMLDYLLLRPEVQSLWSQNAPETLQYVVVDELHTFDGAQGTDLACLLRRLKDRLKTPKNRMCCVGTSATIGGKAEEESLRIYAETMFQEPFEGMCVIRESRMSLAEYLTDSFIVYAHIHFGHANELDPNEYSSEAAYLHKQHKIWFGVETQGAIDNAWRVALAPKLRGHLFFHNLLRLVKEGIRSVEEIAQEMERIHQFSGVSGVPMSALLNSLCAMISAAKIKIPVDTKEKPDHKPDDKPDDEPDGVMPFLHIRFQLWMRELRRMVADVAQIPVLRFADDLTEDMAYRSLPVLQCRECGATGWGGIHHTGSHKIQDHLQEFYRHFFRAIPDLVVIFPSTSDDPMQQRLGRAFQLCSGCLHLHEEDDRVCGSCGNSRLVMVRLFQESKKDQHNHLWASKDCPYCDASSSLTILGSRAASLISVFLSQMYGSFYNDDKKAITFSDSVQDAAHRAGFFGARTYRFNFRAALQQCVQHQERVRSLADLSEQMQTYWQTRMEPAHYMASFLAPNMEWLPEYEEFKQTPDLSRHESLSTMVRQRMSWEICSEYGYRARIGRSLERSGSSVVYPDPAMMDAVSQACERRLYNEWEWFRHIESPKIRPFLLAVVMHLKLQGAIFHAGLRSYIEDLGNIYRLNRIPWMTKYSQQQRIPMFLVDEGTPGHFERLFVPRGRPSSWYERWVLKCFERDGQKLLTFPEIQDIWRCVLQSLREGGLLRVEEVKGSHVWGLQPQHLLVTTQTAKFACDVCSYEVTVAVQEAESWQEMPCLQGRCRGHFRAKEQKTDYYHRLYSTSEIQRIIAQEHTGLLDRETREQLERSFIQRSYPWEPNLLSATPTLEMGIDIGDLSCVVLCSMPPSQASYVQRIGRAGRRDGNAVNLIMATGHTHDLYFFDEPLEMMAGEIRPPGIFLRATAVLERQLTAFALQRWISPQQQNTKHYPRKLGTLLHTVLLWEKSRTSLDTPKTAESSETPLRPDRFPFDLFRYIEEKQTELLTDFVALFGGALDEEDIAHLRAFLLGDDSTQGSLPYKMIHGLYYQCKERTALEDNRNKLARIMREKKTSPAKDKDHSATMRDLQIEHTAVSRLLQELNQKDTLQFLTEEGWLPNYAFPEAGVTLKSLIYRMQQKKKGPAKASQKHEIEHVEHWIYEYGRPSALALTELAPWSTFYAGGRRVQIDQINMRISEAEYWRLCDNCDYTERMIGQTSPACPRCGSRRWSDGGQKRLLLRMRQVLATTGDKHSRIADDSDDRELSFFNRRMLVDFDPHDLRQAYAVDSESLPFGFEFLNKATFREINLGERGEIGHTVKMAGTEFPNKGFTLCLGCGKVQKNQEELKHTQSCKYRNKDDQTGISECVFLYREFTSEAIRILLPVSTEAYSLRGLQSLVAAFHLGLERKFLGAVEHIETTLQDEPISQVSYRKRYLVVYDRIPGGTGYLKQLMRSPEPLLGVLDTALHVLRHCRCHQDPEKDGCYRCLYAYRVRADMSFASRDAAIEILSEILEHRSHLQPVDGLRTLSIHALIDSELEARFVEALRRFQQPGWHLHVRNIVVAGRPAYLLKLTKDGKILSYTIESQVSLGPHEGVSVPSKADFVIRSTRNHGGSKPIVVFTDGFMYHRDRIHVDMAQRMALVQSKHYHIWSLTWHDVDCQLRTTHSHQVHDWLGPLTPDIQKINEPKLLEHFGLTSLRRLPQENSFVWLMMFLMNPMAQDWQRYAWMRVAMWWYPGLPSPSVTQRPALGTEELWALWDHLPLPCKEGAFVDFAKTPYMQLAFRFPEAQAHHKQPQQAVVLACLQDDHALQEHTEDTKPFEVAWNSYLRLYNLLQFVPGAFFTTRNGLLEGHFHGVFYEWATETLSSPVGRGIESSDESAWSEWLALLDESLHPLLHACRKAGWSMPEPCHELADANGTLVAQAELAWPDRKLAVLRDVTESQRMRYQQAGWRVVSIEQSSDPHFFCP